MQKRLASNNLSSKECLKYDISEVLEFRDLVINKDKTEQYLINRTTHEWRKSQHLGNMLGTSEDIKRRRALAINAAIRMLTIFDNKKLN